MYYTVYNIPFDGFNGKWQEQLLLNKHSIVVFNSSFCENSGKDLLLAFSILPVGVVMCD